MKTESSFWGDSAFRFLEDYSGNEICFMFETNIKNFFPDFLQEKFSKKFSKKVLENIRILYIFAQNLKATMTMRAKSNERVVEGYGLSNNIFNGGIECTFEHNGKMYWADLCYLRGYDIPTTECMIFESDGNEVTDWTELYCRRHIPFTDNSLVECINEFKNENQK